jgi:hypothetical protein
MHSDANQTDQKKRVGDSNSSQKNRSDAQCWQIYAYTYNRFFAFDSRQPQYTEAKIFSSLSARALQMQKFFISA